MIAVIILIFRMQVVENAPPAAVQRAVEIEIGLEPAEIREDVLPCIEPFDARLCWRRTQTQNKCRLSPGQMYLSPKNSGIR